MVVYANGSAGEAVATACVRANCGCSKQISAGTGACDKVAMPTKQCSRNHDGDKSRAPLSAAAATVAYGMALLILGMHTGTAVLHALRSTGPGCKSQLGQLNERVAATALGSWGPGIS
jgi:hypothetical protein